MRRSVRGALFAAVATFAGACGDQPAPPPTNVAPPPPVSTAVDPSPPTPTPPTPSLPARVFVDVSGSMRGFIHRGARTVADVHQSVEDSLAAAGRAGPVRCLVGETVTCGDGVPTTTAGFDEARLYTATTSRLDAVLRRAPVPERVDPDHPPPPDYLDDAFVTVLVTDGMQVSGHAIGSSDGSTGEAACAAAADPHCIASLLSARVREGFGVWVIHQWLAFDGEHFGERLLDAGHIDQATAHAADVALDSRFNGVEFRVGRASTDTHAGTSSFTYHGVKPLLMFVMARDASLGRRVVDGIVTRLRAQPLAPGHMTPEFATQSVELAPLTGTRYTLVALEPAPREDQASIDAELQREVRVRESAVAETGDLSASVWCGARGRAMLYVRYGVTTPTPLPLYLTEAALLHGPISTTPLPEHAMADPEARAEASAFRIGVNCTVLDAGTRTVGYELQRGLTLDTAAASHAWWSEFSSDDSYRSPERAYGLRELVGGVVATAAETPTRQGRVRVAIAREAE